MIRQRSKSRESDDFFTLVKAFALRPIRTAKEHEGASRMLTRLVASKPEGKLSSGERDYIEALTILVRDYQQKRQDARRAEMEPREILRHLVQENGMTVSDLGRVIGS